MLDPSIAVPPPLEAAVLAWNDAVEAVVRETYRITAGGTDDLAHMAELKAAVETARQRCEQLADSLFPPP